MIVVRKTKSFLFERNKYVITQVSSEADKIFEKSDFGNHLGNERNWKGNETSEITRE